MERDDTLLCVILLHKLPNLLLKILSLVVFIASAFNVSDFLCPHFLLPPLVLTVLFLVSLCRLIHVKIGRDHVLLLVLQVEQPLSDLKAQVVGHI